MDLLILLVERRGALVTRAEIIDRLWAPTFSSRWTSRSIRRSERSGRRCAIRRRSRRASRQYRVRVTGSSPTSRHRPCTQRHVSARRLGSGGGRSVASHRTADRLPEQVHMWSQSYDGRPSNMLEWQRELREAIAGQIRVTLSPGRLIALGTGEQPKHRIGERSPSIPVTAARVARTDELAPSIRMNSVL
jgi:hypothetical protein